MRLVQCRQQAEHGAGHGLTPDVLSYVPVVTGASGVCAVVSEAEQCWQAGEFEIHPVTCRNCGTYFLHRLLVTVWGQRSILYVPRNFLSGDLKPPHRQKFFRNGLGKLVAIKYRKSLVSRW